MIPVVGQIIRPGLEESLVRGPQRVLAVHSTSDVVWLIGLPRSAPAEGCKKKHMLGPEQYSISDISDAIERGKIVMEDVPLPGFWQMTDADYLSAALTSGERNRRESRLKKRDYRWSVIEGIVGKQIAREIVSVPSVLRERILAKAKEDALSVPTIYSWLHRYWAGRECINSLLPNTSCCGNPGQRKKPAANRLGRKSRAAKAGRIESDGYILAEEDRERLACGYALVKPGTTVHDAYRLTMGAFWAETTQDEQGHLQHKLLPIHERPTQPQFQYWGRQLHGDPLRRKMMGIDRWATSTLTVTGSTQDQVHAVGQVAMIDSTSTDVYLTSMMSRLKVLPPMHRTIVKDVRSSMLLGFYLGWEDPSSATSLQAILCAASDKRELAARFDIELKEDQWPGLLARHFLADNGEMKSQALMEAERQFRFGIEFVKAYSGQSKSQVENQHHTDHKALDHKLPGTTRGRQRQRGELPPSTQALWNYSEYVREFILGAIAYNNQEAPHLAPTDMTLAGVRPTRINIFRWLRDHNMRADIRCDLNLLRAFMLPDHAAVIRRDGIHLLMKNGIRQLPGHRFFADGLTRDNRWQLAARNKGSVKVCVKFDAQDLHHVWLPTSGGLLKIPNVMAEQALLKGLTITDWVDYQSGEDLHLDNARQVCDQEGLDTLVRRGRTTDNARLEKIAEERQLAKPPSKKAKPSQLRKNKDDEKKFLNAPIAPQVSVLETVENVSLVSQAEDASDLAMKAFHHRAEV